MGRFIGSFMDDNELDRPDLNKCPDCECYFPQDNCPICGKVCPEEMRAGNRKTVKKKVKRNGRSRAVQYVDWYHKWWFIILMMVIFPIMGIILLIGSPHSRNAKIAVIILAVVYMVASYFGIGNIVNLVESYLEKPVNTALSAEEYKDKCEEIAPVDFFRAPDDFKKKYVRMDLTVVDSFTDTDGYYSKRKYNEYYVCSFKSETGMDFRLIVRGCIQSGVRNLTTGDKVTVYGEGAGTVSLYDFEGNQHNGACINAAYFELK